MQSNIIETGFENFYRFVKSSDSGIIKIGNRNCWYLLKFYKAEKNNGRPIKKNSLPHGVKCIYFRYLSGSDGPLNQLIMIEVSYTRLDVEYNIEYRGKTAIQLHDIYPEGEKEIVNSSYFKTMDGNPSLMGIEAYFKCTHIRLSELPLYMDNPSKLFHKLLKEGAS